MVARTCKQPEDTASEHHKVDDTKTHDPENIHTKLYMYVVTRCCLRVYFAVMILVCCRYTYVVLRLLVTVHMGVVFVCAVDRDTF